MLWEAQSRYILGYFVLMLPLAAWGLDKILNGFSQVLRKITLADGETRIMKKTGGNENK